MTTALTPAFTPSLPPRHPLLYGPFVSSAPGPSWPNGPLPGFHDDDLLAVLEGASLADLDLLPFGLITMDRAGKVIGYNAFEAQRAGIARERVLSRHFFTDVGPCTNNYLVAERYVALGPQDDLDDELDYVFTFRMKPTPVRLRLLAKAGSARQYLAVRNR